MLFQTALYFMVVNFHLRQLERRFLRAPGTLPSKLTQDGMIGTEHSVFAPLEVAIYSLV